MVLSGVNNSGAVQLMDALVREKGSKIVEFRPKSPRRARGGWVSLIRMFDWKSLQGGVEFGGHDNETYPSNIPVHRSHPVEELQTARHIDQLRGNGRQIPHLFVA